jgi:dsDNA-specific endonuclease/ATPase MutS2
LRSCRINTLRFSLLEGKELNTERKRTMTIIESGGSRKVKRVPMTKVERAQKRAEKERQAINRLRELVEELEQRLKEMGRSLLQVYEKLSQAAKGKNG